jgi:hypothetical protein
LYAQVHCDSGQCDQQLDDVALDAIDIEPAMQLPSEQPTLQVGVK